ncbi:MAG: ABC transporter ATP-binding protein [Lentisphaeria bacterium]|nr:ABC transporter ATP-binding protein [Lentisphaeria bacterium]
MDSFADQLRWLFSPRDKYRFLLITLAVAFSALLELAGIGILLGAATAFLSPESSAGQKAFSLIKNIMPGLSDEHLIAAAILFIGLLLAGKNIIAYLIVKIQAKFIFAKRHELSCRLYRLYLYSDHLQFSSLSQDYCFNTFQRVYDLTHVILMPLMQILADILVIIALTVAAVIIFPAVSICGIAFIVICAAAVSFITKRANRKCGKKFLAASIEENILRQAGIAGEKSIKYAGAEKFFSERFDAAYAGMNDLSRQLYTLGQIPRLSLESASVLLASGVFVIMLIMQVEKTEIMLTFAVLTAVIGRILPALSRSHYNLTLIRQSRPLLNDVCNILQKFKCAPLPVTENIPDAGKNIEIAGVSFGYEKDKKIFENFSLVIKPLSSTAIAGRSGKGKSTLVDLLTGLLVPESGSITAGGISIYDNLPAWRKQISIVPQNIFLLEATVAENVAFGEEKIDEAKVKEALKLAGLEEFSPEMKLSAAGNISGGQRQRIGIARALYRQSRLLILDEATSALDKETENAFLQVLQNLKGEITLIVISHRESTLDYCDNKIFL